MTDELTLDYVKNYLRIDYDEEQEDRFVEMCINACLLYTSPSPRD